MLMLSDGDAVCVAHTDAEPVALGVVDCERDTPPDDDVDRDARIDAVVVPHALRDRDARPDAVGDTAGLCDAHVDIDRVAVISPETDGDLDGENVPDDDTLVLVLLDTERAAVNVPQCDGDSVPDTDRLVLVQPVMEPVAFAELESEPDGEGERECVGETDSE